MREQLKFKINNDFKELKILNRSIRTFLSSINICSKTIYNVDLILEEMITNIIKYGYNDNDKHKIEVNINVTAKYIRIRIIDDGKEFNPVLSPTPNTDIPIEEMKIGGLGIYIVKNISDNNIKYKRHKNKNIYRIKLHTKSC